jgi:hypothetical protein
VLFGTYNYSGLIKDNGMMTLKLWMCESLTVLSEKCAILSGITFLWVIFT